jgi:acetolactate synthase-1/2/3 large subunit
MNELATMRDSNADIRILLVRNRYLGLVREYQHYNYDSHYSGVDLKEWPDYGKIAEAYGIPCSECTSNEPLDEALDEFLGGEGPRMLVCEVDSENNVK